MINQYDAEVLVKAYSILTKKCNSIDSLLSIMATTFDMTASEFSSLDTYDEMSRLMDKKTRLLKLKDIIKTSVNKLDKKYKKVLAFIVGMRKTVRETADAFKIGERTIFRRKNKAYQTLSHILNKSEDFKFIEHMLESENELLRVRKEIYEHYCLSKI